ncbi:outer membrane beta-barrel protein [Halovulum sp. GXIMD14793]
MKYAYIAAAFLIAAPVAGLAQSGLTAGNVGISYDYRNLSSGGGSTDVDSYNINGDVAFDITPRFGMQIGADYRDFGRLSAANIDLHGYTRFGNAKVGAFFRYKNYAISSGDFDALSYGIEAMIDGGKVDYEFRLGQEDIDLPGWAEFTYAGASVYYDFNQNLTFVGDLTYSDHFVFDSFGVSVGADYYFNQRIKLSGRVGYENLSQNFGGGTIDGYRAGIGLSYDFGGRKDRLFGTQSPSDDLLSLLFD